MEDSLGPLDAGDGGGSRVHGTGACSLVVKFESDAADPDAGSYFGGDGKATSRLIQIWGDINGSPGIEVRCETRAELFTLTMTDGVLRGEGRLTTLYGSDGTGAGTAVCDVDVTTWPTQPASDVVGTFKCAPMKMTWGSTILLSGTFSTK